MSDEEPGMNAGDVAAIERAIALLAATEAAAAPMPSDALVARVLADAAASRPAAVALPHPGAMRAGRAAAARPRARWSMGGMGAAAALAAGLVFGFVAGFAGPEPEMVSVAMAAEDEVIVVSDAGLALFDAEQPF